MVPVNRDLSSVCILIVTLTASLSGAQGPTAAPAPVVRASPTTTASAAALTLVVDRDRESWRLRTGPTAPLPAPGLPGASATPLPPAPTTSLTLLHLAGTVTVIGSGGADVLIDLVREGRGLGPEAARAHRDRLRMDSRVDHGHTVLRTLCWGGHSGAPFVPGARGPLEGQLAPSEAAAYVLRGETPPLAHVTLTIPPQFPVTIQTVFGTVLVKQTRSAMVVKTTTGLVDVDSCEGRLHVETTSGAVFLRGQTDLKSRILTRSGSVRARDYKGQLDIETRSGPIDVNYRDPGRGDHHLVTATGAITVRVPRTARLSVDYHGPRRRLLQGLPLSHVHDSDYRLTGILQEGLGSLDVRTKSGTVRLEPR